MLTQVIPGVDIAQPITPPASSVVFLNPSYPLLMRKHGKPRPAPEKLSPLLRSCYLAPFEGSIQLIVPFVNRHR